MYYYPIASRRAANHDGSARLEDRFEVLGVAGQQRLYPRRAVAGWQTGRGTATHRVLVPVDGSESALRAAAHLIGLVHHRAPLEVHVLNVQPPIMSSDVSTTVTAEMVKRVRLADGEEVLRRARGLLDRIGVRYVTSILLGVPAETIAGYVEDHAIDAIVMGTRGMSALKNFLLGSVAAKVVGLAEVPVTLVK